MSMQALRLSFVLVLAGLVASPAVRAQEPKASAELAVLKKLVGAWDATMDQGGMKSKGTMTYKMEVGGAWLVGDFEGDFGGTKFNGKGLDSYDANKKKYVSVWVDSMSTAPMTMEGSFDAATKTMTMSGQGTGPDGKAIKMKMVTQFKDEDTILSSMYPGDEKDAMFQITYKRKK
jgi:Protein of unknown function (DUF1579)